MVTDSYMKQCPFCLEQIKALAIRCKHCHADLQLHGRQPGLVKDLTRAEAVPDDRIEVQSLEVQDLLASLIEKNLVYASGEPTAQRFHLQDSVRAFAWEHLTHSNEAITTLARHLDCFLTMAEHGALQYDQLLRPSFSLPLFDEHHNIRTALMQCRRDHAKIGEEMRLIWAMRPFWDRYERLTDGRQECEETIRRAASLPSSALKARIHVMAGWMAYLQGDLTASLNHAKSCVQLFLEIGDEVEATRNKMNLAVLYHRQRAFAKAHLLCKDALRVWRSRKDVEGQARALKTLGSVLSDTADYPGAQSTFEECLELFRNSGNEIEAAYSLHDIGDVHCRQGLLERASQHYHESLKIGMRLDDYLAVALSQMRLARVAEILGRCDEARSLLLSSIASLRANENRFTLISALNMLATIERRRGEYDSARSLLSEGIRTARRVGDQVGLVCVLRAFALLAVAEGINSRAAILISAADRLNDSIGDPLPRDDLQAHGLEITSEIRTLLHATAGEGCARTGSGLTTEGAVAYALEQPVDVTERGSTAVPCTYDPR